jgi:hypothetical protein
MKEELKLIVLKRTGLISRSGIMIGIELHLAGTVTVLGLLREFMPESALVATGEALAKDYGALFYGFGFDSSVVVQNNTAE